MANDNYINKDQDPEIKKSVESYYDSLPQVIKDSIDQSNWEDKIRKITRSHDLHIDQGQILENNTFMMLIGLMDPVDFTKKLIQEAKMSKKEAMEIAKEIDTEIFRIIKDYLIEKTVDEVEAGETSQSQPLNLASSEEIEASLPNINESQSSSSSEISVGTNEGGQTSVSINNSQEEVPETPKAAPPQNDPYRESIE